MTFRGGRIRAVPAAAALLLAAAWLAAPRAVAAPVQAQQKIRDVKGTVLETLDVGSYTYVRLDTGTEKLWAAAPRFSVRVGDVALIAEATPMADFYSPSLERSFEVIYFAGSITVAGASGKPSPPRSHGAAGGGAKAASVDVSDVARAEGGQTIAELHAKRAEFADREVRVRGRVIKYAPRIMGRNWIHLKDASVAEGTKDLTVTTQAEAKVGDTVVVRGTLRTGRDIGAGYKYELLIEEAELSVE